MIVSYDQVQKNIRNVIALWAKDLGLNENLFKKDDDEEAIVEGELDNAQNHEEVKKLTAAQEAQARSYDYMQSLANFIEIEIITLLGFQQTVNNSICKVIEKSLKKHDASY